MLTGDTDASSGEATVAGYRYDHLSGAALDLSLFLTLFQKTDAFVPTNIKDRFKSCLSNMLLIKRLGKYIFNPQNVTNKQKNP